MKAEPNCLATIAREINGPREERLRGKAYRTGAGLGAVVDIDWDPVRSVVRGNFHDNVVVALIGIPIQEVQEGLPLRWNHDGVVIGQE